MSAAFHRLLSTGLAAALTSGAFAQTQLNTSGRLMDANPALGGTGLNNSAIRPYSPLIGGNPYASGNVRGGMSLRSFNPIGDPSAFQGNLGSTSLSDFIRDSVSVADVSSLNWGLAPTPYYDPARTAPTVGFLRGNLGLTPAYAQPQLESTNRSAILPGLLNYSGNQPRPANVAPLLSPNSAIAPLMPTPFGESDTMTSGVFGLTRVGPRAPTSMYGPNAPTPRDPAQPLNPVDLERPWQQPGVPQPDARPDMATSRLDLRQKADPIGAPLDLILKGDAASLLESRRPMGLPMPEPMARATPAGRPTSTDFPAATDLSPRGTPAVADRPMLRDTSMLPGHDTFTDMRLALSLEKDPQAAWWGEMREAGRQGSGAAARSAQADSAVEAQQFIDRVMKSKLTTFAGEGRSAMNEEMLRAEGLLQTGQFYDAASRYQQASRLDPTNPLPLIGRGHALLAAGDYLSAAVQLTRGFERFPDLARFSVDLRSFLGSGEIIDIRRADIMRQLARNEDLQLRFLLGYLEYYTGDTMHGLENLDQAAEAAEFGTIIKRFPDMLRGTAPLPPPKLNLDAPIVPADGTTGD